MEIILLLALVIVVLLLLVLGRRKEPKLPTSPPPQPPLDDEVKKLQEELAQRLQEVQEKEEELSDRLVYENYVEGQFSHLLAIAIQGVIKENSPPIRWTKVTPDTMPPEEETIIVTIKDSNGRKYVSTEAKFRPESVIGKWWTYNFTSESFEPIYDSETVTHWMRDIEPAED